jgi:hypothetical protein
MGEYRSVSFVSTSSDADFPYIYLQFQKQTLAGCQWLTPVILTTQEAERLGGSWFEASLGK